jgi:hypothetical protein
MIQTVVHFARSLAQLHRMPASRRNLVTRLFAILGIILVPGILLLLWQPSAWALDIGPLLDTCPQRDPAYFQIRSDFEIRRNGVPVQEILCSEPISQLPISQYTDELIVVQGLRAVFYTDLGSTPLPWAPGMTLYDWMKSKSAGIGGVPSRVEKRTRSFRLGHRSMSARSGRRAPLTHGALPARATIVITSMRRYPPSGGMHASEHHAAGRRRW